MQFSVLRGLRFVRAAMLFVVLISFHFEFNRNAFALSSEECSREALLARSELIIVGTVLTAKSDWTDGRQQMIDTRYSVRVDQVVVDDPRAGKAAVGPVLELVFKGGAVGDVSIDIPGVPRFKPGDRAVFFLGETSEGKLSPLVGINQGLYSIVGGKGAEEVVPFVQDGCCQAHAMTRNAKAEGGLPLETFVKQIKAELPAARSGVKRGNQGRYVAPVVTPESELQILNKDKNPTYSVLAPEESYRPVEESEGSGSADTRYAWLPWGSSYTRPGPITFNIPPVFDDAYRQQAIEALTRWNQYADVFQYTELAQSYGPRNKRNEIVFDTVANIRSKYNYDASGIYGVMIPYATNGKVSETDILIPTDSVDWAFDFESSWNSLWAGGSNFKPYMLATLLHEVGHSFGREHTFNENQVDWLSTMDYGPSWFRSLRHIVYSDDACSARARYKAKDITDAGLFFYYADASQEGNGKYKLSSLSSAYVSAGDRVTLDNFVIENIGNQPMSDLRIQWQLRDTGGSSVYNGDYQVLEGTLPVGACWPMQNWEITIPCSAPSGTYQLYARLDWAGENVSDGVAHNNVSMIPAQITVSNNLPDLVDAGSAARSCTPMAAFPGQKVFAECEIQNAGISSSGNFKVAFYAFSMTDETVAYMLGYTSMSSLKAGKKATCKFEGNFPSHGKAGQYLVMWEIDYDGIITETDESNNVASQEDYVLDIMERPDVDLKFNAISSTMKVKGRSGKIKGDVVVTNVGSLTSQPCQMGVYYLDYAQGTLIKLQDIAIPALASNESITLQPGTALVEASKPKQKKVKRKKVKFAFAEDFSPTDKHLALIIDDLNQVAEGNEENNLYTTPLNGAKKSKKK